MSISELSHIFRWFEPLTLEFCNRSHNELKNRFIQVKKLNIKIMNPRHIFIYTKEQNLSK